MHKPVLQLIGGNVLSKILGAAREVLLAALFGTGASMGAFRVAQTGALTPAHFFLSDGFNAAFVPLYKKYLYDSREKAQTLLWGLMAVFMFIALFLSFVLWLSAERWINIIAPGLSSETAILGSGMLRIMAIGIPFYVFSSLLVFLGMGNEDFIPAAIRQSIQNAGLISGALAAFIFCDIELLAWGFTISYLAFCGLLALRFMRFGFLAFPERWLWPEFREVIHVFWLTLRPLLFLPLMLQGSIVIERLVASLIGIAAVSSLDYAKFISETLIFIVALPLAQAGLVYWSGVEHQQMTKSLKKILLLIFLVALPVSTFLASNAELVVKIVYARGAFDHEAIEVTSSILFGVSLGLWAQTAGYVFVKALNAQFRNAAVLKIMVAALLVSSACNLFLYPFIGPLTLGVANSMYGIVLLIGTLYTLDLVYDALKTGFGIALGCAGYLLSGNMIPSFENLWLHFTVEAGYASAYWLLLMFVVPSWRAGVRNFVTSLKGGDR